MNKISYEDQLDSVLKQDFSSFIEKERARLSKLTEKFGESFILFGAGDLGKRMVECLRSIGIEPKAFCDNNPMLWDKSVYGLKVLPPQKAAEIWGQKAIFVITIHDKDQVEGQLSSLGLVFLSYGDLILYYPHLQDRHIFLGTDAFKIFDHRDEIKQTLALWADDISKRLFVARINYGITLNYNFLFTGSSAGQMYFLPDLTAFSSDEVFVDGGAYDGDTVRSIVEKHGSNFKKIICIEPDPANYQKLTHYLETLPGDVRAKIAPLQAALGSVSGKENFDAFGTVGSKIASSGAYQVEVVTIDEAFGDDAPTYIKLDIEGAEIDALQGGKNIIKDRLPVLAICVYHKQEHLWQIPLLIRSFSREYSLFLRNYSGTLQDTVCYAIPKKRLIK